MVDRLNIVSTQSKSSEPPFANSKNGWRYEAQAKFERMWLMDPEQFNPMRNCLERERLQRTKDLIQRFMDSKNKWVADLACGGGTLSKHLYELGAHIHALDIASNALSRLKMTVPQIDQTFQQCLPHTTLEDDSYDLVIANEVIAYLPTEQLRLFMAELSRLVKPQGYVICSTPLDLNTQDPLQRFASLAETEFKIHEWVCSYHRLYIRLKNFFSAPSHFAKARKDREYLLQESQNRHGFSRKWFLWNSHGFLAAVWSIVQYITNPIAHFIKQSRSLMLMLEKICRLLFGDAGISHAIFIATRRPLQPLHLTKNETPIERKGKREIWE